MFTRSRTAASRPAAAVERRTCPSSPPTSGRTSGIPVWTVAALNSENPAGPVLALPADARWKFPPPLLTGALFDLRVTGEVCGT